MKVKRSGEASGAGTTNLGGKRFGTGTNSVGGAVGGVGGGGGGGGGCGKWLCGERLGEPEGGWPRGATIRNLALAPSQSLEGPRTICAPVDSKQTARPSRNDGTEISQHDVDRAI